MGMGGLEDEITGRLASDARYREPFAGAFPGEEISVNSFDSRSLRLCAPWCPIVPHLNNSWLVTLQRFPSLRKGVQNYSIRRDWAVVIVTRDSRSQRCNLLLQVRSQHPPFTTLVSTIVDGEGGYPSAAQGLIEESGFAKDMGRFRVPSLRNVALTAPYGHDGSAATLDDFIRIYEEAGRNVEAGSNQGDGRNNPWLRT